MISYDVVRFGAPLERSERPTPTPTGGAVLLKVLAAGVCHSDVHIQSGVYDLGGGKQLKMGERGVNLPLTMGHETAGEVVALGPDARGVKVGDKRLVFPWLGCGSCAVCKREQENLCMKPRSLGVYMAGGYSDHILVPDARYLLDIGDLTPAQAAPYACSGLTAYSALRKIDKRVLEQEPVVVMGAGGLGLICIQILKAMGGRGAIAVDIDPKKRAAALEAGAIAAVDGAAPDAVKQIQAAGGGPIWAAVDFVGAQSTIQLAIASLVKGGQVVVVGLFGGDVTISTPMFPLRAMAVQGSYTGSLPELAELMALVRSAKIPSVPITTRPLEDAQAALMDLEHGKVIGRTVLQPRF